MKNSFDIHSSILLSRTHRSDVDEKGRHIFSDDDLHVFALSILKIGSSRLLNALDGMGVGQGDLAACNELEVARQELVALVGGEDVSDEFDSPELIEGLTAVQSEFVRKVPYAKAEIADYLRRGVEVAVVRNTEVPEAPAFALDVVENPSFWIDCFSTPEEAKVFAGKVGLILVN